MGNSEKIGKIEENGGIEKMELEGERVEERGRRRGGGGEGAEVRGRRRRGGREGGEKKRRGGKN